MNSQRILIIGGAGFLGANLVRRLISQGSCDITVLDSLDASFHSSLSSLESVLPQIKFVRGDLRDAQVLDSVVRDQEVIYQCAGQTSHPLSLKDPLMDADINCLGNLKILESVRVNNPKARVIYVSTSTVIGRARTDLITEDHLERPLEIYSANKGVAEKYYQIYHNVHGLNTVVIRLANLYGPYGKGFPEFSFMNYFIHLAKSDQPIRIFGAGDQLRNVLHAQDASDALIAAAQMESLDGRIYFATGDEHLSVCEIAKTIVETLGRGSVVFESWPEERKKIEVDGVKFSSALFRSVTSWRPKIDLRTGLKMVLEQE